MTMNAYEMIRDAILSGKYPPGEMLAENGLAAELGVSRTPVREALHRLESEQLVERMARGARVRTSSPEEILDIYEVRITLEGSAAKQAALRATELDKMRLRTAHEAMLQVGDSAAARVQTNRAFHEAVWQASHSPTLVDLLRRLNVHLIRYPTTTLSWGDRWNTVIAEHEELLVAIEAGDGARAQDIAEKHLTGAREVRLRMYTTLA